MTRSLCGRAIRVLGAGAAASAADVALLLALSSLLRLPVAAAAALGCLAGGAVNFVLNRRFVFSCRKGCWWRQWLGYLGLVVLGGALVCGGLVHVGAVWLDLPLLVAKGAAALLVLATWNYPISALWIFGGNSWRRRTCRSSSQPTTRWSASLPRYAPSPSG